MASGRNVVGEDRPASGLTVRMSAEVSGVPGNAYRSQRLMRPSARSAALSKWCDTGGLLHWLAEARGCVTHGAMARCRSAVGWPARAVRAPPAADKPVILTWCVLACSGHWQP